MADSTEKPLRAGVIGLGIIGGGIALSLARRGRVPAVFDVRPDAAKSLKGVPSQLESPAEVARASDVVIIAVVDAEQAREVIAGNHGLLEGKHPGLVIVVASTISVEVLRELRKLCEVHGVGLLDCGVYNATRAAENGLLAVVGGAQDEVKLVRPVLEDFAAQVIYCGSTGAGMVTKIAGNAVAYGCWAAVHEAVELGVAAGVEAATLVEVIGELLDCGQTVLMHQKLRMAGKGVDAVSSRAGIHRRNMDKDLDAAQQLATEADMAIPLIDVTRAQGADMFAWLEDGHPA